MRLEPIILRALMQKRFWLEFHGALRPGIFGAYVWKTVYEGIARRHEEQGTDLTAQDLLVDLGIRHDKNPNFMQELRQAVEDLQEVEAPNPDSFSRQLQVFLQRQYALKAAEYAASHKASPDFSIDTFLALTEQARQASDLLDSGVVDFADAPIVDEKMARRIPLGISEDLDDALQGGIGAGELSLFLAGSGKGKTSYLCYVGAQAALHGKRVLHITLEISTPMVIRRLDQSLTHLSRAALTDQEDAIKRARRAVADSGGHIYIKNWSYTHATPALIESLIRQMKNKEQDVDLLIVDYLELLNPTGPKQSEGRFNYASVAKDMRALAVRLDIPVLTAWQVNRTGANVEIVGMTDISESYEVVKIADLILGLNQTAEELDNHRMRVNIIKQRQSTERSTARLYSDLQTMTIRAATVQDDIEKLQEWLPPKTEENDDGQEHFGVSGEGTSEAGSTDAGTEGNDDTGLSGETEGIERAV